jgi:hypothetical protein
MTVRSWLAGLHELGEVTPTTIAKAYRLLRRVLNVAVEAGYLPRNPAVIKGAGLERAAEMRHVSIPRLHTLAETVPGRSRALVLVAGYGGLRWGELVGLRRRRVDLAGARIHVVEQVAEVAGKFIVTPPKTTAGHRVVVLPAVAVAAWLTTWTTTPRPSRRDWSSRAAGAPICNAATSAGSCGGQPASSSACPGCASTTCGTRPQPCRGRRRDHQGADGAHGPHLAGGGPALPARHGRPPGRHRRRAGWPGPRCSADGGRAPPEGTWRAPRSTAGEREEGGRLVSCAFGWSGRRESNPHRELGKLEFCH